MKKRNKKAIIITAIVMIISVLLVLAGIFGGSVAALFTGTFNFDDIKPEDVGRNIKTDIHVLYEDFGVAGMTTLNLHGNDNCILLDLSGLSDADKSLFYSKYYQHVTIHGTIRAATDDEIRAVKDYYAKQYDYIFYQKIGMDEETYKATPDPDNRLESFHQMMFSMIMPYCIEVTSVTCFNWIPFIPAGIIIFLLALVVEICFVFKLKKRIVLPVVYALMIIVPSILLFNHIRTMLTVKKVSDGFYTMKNLECTDTEGMLSSNSATANDMLDWVFHRHLYGMPNVFNIDKTHLGFGCVAFAATTPEGDHLFGRNFDLAETDTVLIYSHPEGCYESIGVADLGILGVGHNSPISPDSPLGKFIMVTTPYFVVDGMNEKGVAAGILTVGTDEPHQDNGKPDLLVYCAVRGILDNCASVDEAITLLASYDIHSDLGNFHLFITDKTGRYVVVEWLDNKMVTVDYPCCTNSVIAPGEYYDMGIRDGRKDTIEACLGNDRIVSAKEAMAILEKVKDKIGMTEWSCVYNLDNFTVSICIDADYSKVYTFDARDFR